MNASTSSSGNQLPMPPALHEMEELPLPNRTPPHGGSGRTCGRPASRELVQALWCDDEEDAVMLPSKSVPMPNLDPQRSISMETAVFNFMR